MDRLRIAVTGLAATYPFGGVFWDYVQYVLGFMRLGHDVLYVEDTGKWTYDPPNGTFVESGRQSAALLDRHLRRLDPELAARWFVRDARGETFGRSWNDVRAFCRSADLFVHLSASCWMRDEYFRAGTVAFVDTDPMYTQAAVPRYIEGSADDAERERIETMRRHDVFFTFGENVGAAECRIPTELFDWIPTRQPIVLDEFREARVPLQDRRRVLTTLASWEPTEKGPVVGGVGYGAKSVEFERFVDLPARSPVPLELALSGRPPADRLRAKGWRSADPLVISGDPWTYRTYLATSLGEWSVAKNAYVAGRTGWFSCRTACYLALGVPAVVQDTGFSAVLPTGEGVLPFATVRDAVAAVGALAADPAHHSAAALEFAHEHFDARKVLARFLDDAGSVARRSAGAGDAVGERVAQPPA